jgi:hypothetical protein
MEGNGNELSGTHPLPVELMQAFDDELSSGELARVKAHVAHCESCRADWARLQQVTELVAELHGSTGPIPRVALRLPADETRMSGAFVFKNPRAISRVAVLVCSVLVCGAIWLAVRPASNKQRELVRQTSSQTPTAPLPASGTSVSQAGPSTSYARVLQAVKANRPAHWRAIAATQTSALTSPAVKPALHTADTAPQAAQTQTAQDVFWSLPYSNPALASQGAELVRVTLPREAFVMAGVPMASIPLGGPNDRISADVLLGSDGLPFAIRPASYRITSLNH